MSYAGQKLNDKRTAKAVARAKRTKRKPSAAALVRRFKQLKADPAKAAFLRKEYATIHENKGKCGPGMYGHNVITQTLRIIAERYGKAEANRAIRECGLLERGWTEEPE